MEVTKNEKQGNNEFLLSVAVNKPMRDVFENIFLPPSQGSKKIDLPQEISTIVLNCADNEYVPPIHSGYCFRKDLLRSVLTFLMNPRGDGLYLTGPTGSGKTSLITEIFGRLNWPLQQVTCNERFEFGSLRGTWVYKTVPGAKAPEMIFQPGALVTAMKEGHGLLLNEADIAPAGEMSALNDIIEGRPLLIPETGELVKPHPLFRLIVTANSKGAGDETGIYAGVQQQNIAALDRYRVLEVGYPDTKVEVSLLTGILKPSLGSEARSIATNMVKLANKVREQFVGLKGMEGTISVPISTRCLTRWAYLSLDYTGSGNAMKLALQESLLNRANESDRVAIDQMALGIFGQTWENPID